MSRRTRLAIVFLPGLLGIPVLLWWGPIPQDLCYHRFADQRTVFGIPHFGDVVSNLPFVIVGLMGLASKPRLDIAIFFAGLGLTGLGSAYYHLDPNNATLVWDRLPMALAFMGFFAALIRERVDEQLGQRLLWPMVAGGVFGVAYWAWTDDLRLYAIVQFYPLLTGVLMLALMPPDPAHPHSQGYWWAVLSYGVAKITEVTDHAIWALNGVITGHNLKHIFAALGGWWIVRMVRQRRS